ncbi:MAG TPA: ABC transporter ATP-binding protein [Chloroflexota bacterium]|jgi:ABC-type nitrate/sulfonate/bicarbonate transport system ATPase subunit|nr:ABC transporter ATP-binding protein [Chloroflexota bacterium]
MSNLSSSIECADVSYRYPSGLLSLENVNLTVADGEIVAVIGPSGCGKSTLLNLIAGLLHPTSGSISVAGGLPSGRLGRFSYMPQRDLLLPWRSALDNAALLVEIRGESPRAPRDAALVMLKEFGLAGFASARPAELSGGMRQRIALIRTFLPELNVLLDEPFGALDAITRRELWGWLLRIHTSRPRAMLLVTHDVEEAILLADRVYVMSPRPGRTVSEWTIDLPRPRVVSLTTTPDFTALKPRLVEALGQAMGTTAPGSEWAA